MAKERNKIVEWRENPRQFVEDCFPDFQITRHHRVLFEEVRKLTKAKMDVYNHTISRIKGYKELTANEKLEVFNNIKGLPEETIKYAKKQGISIQSGKGTGKDASAAVLIIWFMLCFQYCKIPCTAPSAHQLKDVLFGEISKWYRKSTLYDNENPKNNIFELLSDKFLFTGIKEKGKEWFAIARTANPKNSADEQAKTLDGLHADYMMCVIDEGDGVPEPVFKSLDSTLTGLMCNFVLLIFNPTRRTGSAIESQQKYRESWICLHWDAEESELVSPLQIARYAQYGKDSNVYRVYVKGLPPLADPDTLIPWDWVMAAVDRDIEPCEDDKDVIGIDVARFGDDKTIILHRRGNVVVRILEFKKFDTERVAGWAMGEMFRIEPEFTMVDSIGIGAGVADKLRHRTPYQVLDINVSESSSSKDKFYSLRDELWWNVREVFEKRIISIPNDDELIAQLSTPNYDMPGGRIKVESKKDFKNRLKEAGSDSKSPDKADALCLTYYFTNDEIRKMTAPKRSRRRKASISWRV